MTPVLIRTARFILRELTPDDASEKYLSWFEDPQAKANISAAAQMTRLDDLRAYIAERTARDDVLFLGIFDSASGAHVGNLKYEPLDIERGFATMGVLIGDPVYRGTGVAAEVLTSSGEWLRTQRGIREIVLGVHRANGAAVRAYEKVGFREAPTPHIGTVGADALTMVWTL